ncbi:MAG: hypothetical protein RIC55_22040 [Pirellulaceae bacterium]
MRGFVILLLSLAASTALAEDWAPIPDIEVYDRADWIVVGTLHEQGEGADFTWRISSEETIKGDPPMSFSLTPNRFLFSGVAEDGKRFLFAVGTVAGRHHLFHPACLRDAAQGKADMTAAKKLLDDPADAILDPKRPPDADVAYLLGQRYAPGANIWVQPVTRIQAMDYLRRALDTDDANTLLQVLEAVRRTGDRSLEADIIERLNKETPAYAINPMVGYLEEGGTAAGRKHLESLLQRSSPDYPEGHQIADPCAQALGRIGHADSLPYIERAAEHGVQRAIEALIHHGDIDSFDMLYKAYIAAKEPGSQPNAMHWLVRRSNRPVEAWMHPTTYSTDDGVAMKSKWRDWWTKHRKGMEIVRDIHAARRAWQRERAAP